MLTTVLQIWTPDNGDEYKPVQDLAAMAQDIEDSIINPPYIRITNTQDASPSSTQHGFQIGPTEGVNLIADGNEIMARDGGALSVLNLNLGGDVVLGGQTGTATLPGRLISNHYPWAVAAGRRVFGNVAAGDSSTVTINLPSGRFSLAPVITVSPVSTVPQVRQVSYSNSSSTSFDITYFNGGGTAAGITVAWQAIQMSQTSADG